MEKVEKHDYDYIVKPLEPVKRVDPSAVEVLMGQDFQDRIREQFLLEHPDVVDVRIVPKNKSKEISGQFPLKSNLNRNDSVMSLAHANWVHEVVFDK